MFINKIKQISLMTNARKVIVDLIESDFASIEMKEVEAVSPDILLKLNAKGDIGYAGHATFEYHVRSAESYKLYGGLLQVKKKTIPMGGGDVEKAYENNIYDDLCKREGNRTLTFHEGLSKLVNSLTSENNADVTYSRALGSTVIAYNHLKAIAALVGHSEDDYISKTMGREEILRVNIDELTKRLGIDHEAKYLTDGWRSIAIMQGCIYNCQLKAIRNALAAGEGILLRTLLHEKYREKK